MPTLLSIEVSPRFDRSTSRKLTAVFVQKWKAANPGGTVVVRDLTKTSLPFVDLPWIGGAFTRRKVICLRVRRRSRSRTILLPS